MDKILIKELEMLKEKLAEVKSLSNEKIEGNLKKEAEYEQFLLEKKKQTRQIGKVLNSQEIKLDNLKSLIENLEGKIKDLKNELFLLQRAQKDDISEFEKVKINFDNFKKSGAQKIELLKVQIESAQEALERETEYELEIEKTHQEKLAKEAKNYEEKLRIRKKMIEERFKESEEMYREKKEALLLLVKYLDDKIEDVENKIASKPEEIKALQKTYDKLLKKLDQISRAENELLNESKLINRSLKEALKYFKERPEDVTDSVILGIFIAKANLQWIIKRLEFSFNGSLWIDQQLNQLLQQCNDIIALHNSKNVLLNKNLWESDAEDLKFGLLSQTDDEFFLPKFDSCQNIDAYMMKGTPEDSDFCLDELVTSRCEVSDYCWLSEVNGDSHSGYKTSHRLLYFQIALKVKCEELNSRKFSGVVMIKKKLCQQMLLEALALSKSSSFSLTRDLFMEQIALCGLEGYEEFAPSVWRDQVRNWQNKNGCYGKGMDFENCSTYEVFEKINKTVSFIDDCHSHITAVAISALAFFLRIVLKTAFMA